MSRVLLAILLAGCGPRWTAADAQNAQDISNAALSLEAVCDRDGGPCPAAGVRAIERGTYCAAQSQLYRHGEPTIDGGIGCKR